MRVAFVTNLATYYRRPLFDALAEEHEVDFYFFSRGSERYVTSALAGDALHYAEDSYRRWEIAGQAFIPDLATRLRGERYDVVVKCLNGKLMTPWVAGLALARAVPLVVWTGMWYHPRTTLHRLSAPLTRALYAHADALVVYGEHVRHFLVDEQGVEDAKIFTAGQAVDGEKFERAAESRSGQPSSPEVVYVGQLEARKGVGGLLEAFARVNNPSARLSIIGDGSMRRQIESQIDGATNVELLGHLPQDELASRLAGARCLVIPSVTTRVDREPWGLVVNEAMHSGIPVIASDAVGAAAGGLVEHGVNGLVVREGDVVELHAALARLLDDPGLARAMGRRASGSVKTFDYRRMLNAFDAAMISAVNRQRRPHAG